MRCLSGYSAVTLPMQHPIHHAEWTECSIAEFYYAPAYWNISLQHYSNLLGTLCCLCSTQSLCFAGKRLFRTTIAPHFCCFTESTFHTQSKFAWYVTLWCLAEISVKDYWSITELLLKYDNKKRSGNWIKNILYLCRDIKVDKEHIRPKLFHNPYCHMGG